MNDYVFKDWLDIHKENLKFYGILKDCNLDVLNETLIKTLLDRNVISIFRDFEKEEIAYDWMNEQKNSKEFRQYIYFNKKEYKISQSINDEIYGFISEYVDVEYSSCDYDIDELTFSLKGFLTKEEKLRFLIEKHAEKFPKEADYGIYIEDEIYLKENLSDSDLKYKHYSSWKDLITGNFNNSLVQRYLTEDILKLHQEGEFEFIEYVMRYDLCDENYELFEKIRQWEDFSGKKVLLEFILAKIKELETIDKSELPLKNSKPPKIDVEGKTLEYFLPTNLYENLCTNLKEKNLINDNFKIVAQALPNWTELRAVSCIGWVLSEKKFFTKKLSAKNLVVILSNTFSIKLSEQTYSVAIKIFATSSKNNPDPHLGTFKFINYLS